MRPYDARIQASHARPAVYGTLERETDLSAIRARRALVLLDEQNLSIGARNLGYELQYDMLADQIRSTAKTVDLHVFTAVEPHDGKGARRFEHLGYAVHAKTMRHVRLPDGRVRHDTNVDNLFAFWAGLFAAKTRYGVIVLGSGDYGLSGELSQAIKDRLADRRVDVMTLTLPGSTAQDLDARRNPNITANLEIGLDVLKPRVRQANRSAI